MDGTGEALFWISLAGLAPLVELPAGAPDCDEPLVGASFCDSPEDGTFKLDFEDIYQKENQAKTRNSVQHQRTFIFNGQVNLPSLSYRTPHHTKLQQVVPTPNEKLFTRSRLPNSDHGTKKGKVPSSVTKNSKYAIMYNLQNPPFQFSNCLLVTPGNLRSHEVVRLLFYH